MAADAVICSQQTAGQVERRGAGSSEVVALAAYLDSAVEERRHRYESPESPFDMCSEDDRRALILGAVRYADRLVIFDGMIGSAEGLSRFRRGIEYIARIWVDGRTPPSSTAVELHIVTRAGPGGAGIPGWGLQNTCNKIEAQLCRQLAQSLGVAVSFEVKERSDRFHARYLECRGRAFSFERGFDLFLENGPQGRHIARNFVRPDRAAEEHLKDIRLLKTVYP